MENIIIVSMTQKEINSIIKDKFNFIFLTKENIGSKLFNYFNKDNEILSLIAFHNKPFTLKQVKEILTKEYNS